MNSPRIDDGFWQYLMESQASRQPEDMPLELMPALRARYGNLLREGIASVTVGGLGVDSCCVTVLEAGASTRRIRLDQWLKPAGFVSDLLEVESVPSLTTARSLMLCMYERRDLLQELALFTPHGQSVLENLAASACELNDCDGQVEAAKTVGSTYLDAASTLASYLAPAARDAVEAAVLKKYKETEAFGVGDEDAENEWQELGSILYADGHLLREIGLGELRRQIDASLKRLNPAERTALWFEYGSAKSFIDDNPKSRGSRTYFSLSDDTDSCEQISEQIVNRMIGVAMDDWENRAQH